MAKNPEDEAEGGARQPFERHDGMGCQASKRTACMLTAEQAFRQCPRRAQSAKAKAQQRQWVAWRSQRPEQGLFDHTPGGHQGCHKLPIRSGVLAKRLPRQLYGSIEEGCRTVVERVSKRHRRIKPLKTMGAQREGAEKGRYDREG